MRSRYLAILVLTDYSKLIRFGDDGESAPSAMQLADAIDVFNHTFLAILAGILAFEVDDSYSLSYFIRTLFLLFYLVHIVVF